MRFLPFVILLLIAIHPVLGQDTTNLPPPIFFHPGTVVPTDTTALGQIEIWLQARPEMTVEIKGFRDAEEEPGLAQRRATWVVRQLLQRGTDPAQLVLGVGSEQEMDAIQLMPANRRKVSLRVIAAPKQINGPK